MIRRPILAAGAALAIAGCSAPDAGPAPEPERFHVVAKTFREGFATHPTTAAIVEDRRTGCLYSLAEREGAAPLLTPTGQHAGCRPAAEESL